MKIIFIDDEEVRIKTYEKLFSQFQDSKNDFTFICSIEDYHKCLKDLYKYELVVMDAYLWDEEDAVTTLKNAHLGQTPVVIVSDKFLMKFEVNRAFLELMKNPNVIEIIDLHGYEVNCEKDVNSFQVKIRLALSHYHNYTIVKKANNDPIRILHISDLQFGGPVSPMAFLDEMSIPDLLRTDNIVPDIVIISGDIADKGLRSEYDEAYLWLKKFSNHLWGWYQGTDIANAEIPIKISERFLFVPGNHDFDVNACSANEYIFDWTKMEFVIRESHTTEYTPLGFWQYNQFVNRFYQNAKTVDYSNSCILSSKYAPWGLQFILFNTSASISDQNPSPGQDSPTILNYGQVSQSIESYDSSPGTFHIALSHHSPTDMGWSGSGQQKQENWTQMKTIMKRLNVDMLCFGHLHQDSEPDIIRTNVQKRFISCPSPTLRLDGTARTEGSSLGFNVIELKRKNRKVFDIIITPCVIDSKIGPKPSASFQFSAKDVH